MALPFSRNRLHEPTQAPCGSINGLIRPTGIAVEQQMHGPSAGGSQ